MSYELRQFTATIPAGTPLATPATLPLAMPSRVVRRVRARIPPGPNFLMGWALASGGVNVIPWNPGAWIVGDDEELTWDLEGQLTSGAWQLRGYNTGRYDHSVYLVFELDPPQLLGVVEAAPSFLVVDAGPAPVEAPPAAPIVDGYAAARANAQAAIEMALGGPVTVETAEVPAPGTAAAAAYDAGRAAALAAVRAI